MRTNIYIDKATSVACGTDHIFGYFAQIYTNGWHTNCTCPQCEYDEPAFDGNNLDGWSGVIAYVAKHTGHDITRQIVGV